MRVASSWRLALVMLAPLAACERERAAPPVDTTVATPTLPPDTAAIPSIPTSSWIRSAGPVLAVPGIREAVVARRDRTVAVSPIVAGSALKGPADRMLAELGHEASVVGVARLYRDWCSTLVVDDADAERAGDVEAEGMRCVVAPTIMRDPASSAAVARAVLGSLP